jgi:hypothetical protein
MKNTGDKHKELSDTIMEFLNQPIFAQRLKTIEELTGIPSTTLSKTNTGRLIPKKHIFSLIGFLAPYGFKLYGYSLSMDEQGNLFGQKITDQVKSYELIKFRDDRTEEREITPSDLEEDRPENYESSSFCDLYRVERMIWTCYEDL